MLEINLIPDVKKELLKAQRMRNLVTFASIVVAGFSIGVIILMSMVLAGQKITMDINKSNIDNKFKTLKNIPDGDRAATLRNQLNAIDKVRNSSPDTSRLLGQIITSIRTTGSKEITYSSVQLDPKNNLVTVEASSTNKFPALESFQKTIRETYIMYRKEHKSTGCTFDSAKDNKDGCILEKLAVDDKVNVTDVSIGDDEDGKSVLRFKISFKLNPNALKFSSKDFSVKSPSQKDVTDSKTQIPDGIFKATSSGENK
jgi:hypothetical protein